MSDLIGNTPILRLHERAGESRLFVKLEQFNPLGTAKVRMARAMIDSAEREGRLRHGGHIVESTSGNTGLGLALVALERGYRFTAVVDGHAARDKIDAMRAMGARIEVVSADGDGRLATDARDRRARELAESEPGTFWTAQHDNPANADGYQPLADELVRALGGKIDVLIGAVGTGGSLCGTARRLRAHGLTPRVVGVEPVGSIIFGGPAADYLQSGTGTPAGAAVGSVVDYTIMDEHRKVSDAQAFTTARWLARNRGVMLGGSGGGVIHAATMMLSNLPRGTTLVALACDGGERYMQSIYDDQWINERNLEDVQANADLERILGPRPSTLPRPTASRPAGARVKPKPHHPAGPEIHWHMER